MMIRTQSGKRHISLGDVAYAMPHRREGTHCFVTVILDSNEHVTGIASVDDLEALAMNRHSLDHPPLVA